MTTCKAQMATNGATNLGRARTRSNTAAGSYKTFRTSSHALPPPPISNGGCCIPAPIPPPARRFALGDRQNGAQYRPGMGNVLERDALFDPEFDRQVHQPAHRSSLHASRIESRREHPVFRGLIKPRMGALNDLHRSGIRPTRLVDDRLHDDAAANACVTQ